MKTHQVRKALIGPKVIDRARKARRLGIAPALIALVVLISACGRQIPAYWPDLTVDGDTVYVAEMNGQVFALQADSGQIVWSYPTIERGSGGLLGGCSAPAPSDGPFYAAPAVGQELLFLGSAGEQQRSLLGKGENQSGLRVLNRLGTLQWSFTGTADRTVASPALDADTAYLPSSDYSVYAVDLNARDTRWVFETGNWVWATPLVVEGTVYIASMDHALYAVRAEDGREIWRFDRPTSALPAAPTHADGVLYFGSLDGHVYAVQADSGELEWEHKVDGGVWATPVMADNALYFGTLGGHIYALDTTDGSELWAQSVGGEVRGTPAYANGTVYFGCEDGQLYAFDAQDGTQGISPLGQQADQAAIYTSPVFDGRYLYVVVSDGKVFALDPARNAVVWQATPLNAADEEE